MQPRKPECLEKILENIKAGKNSLVWKKNAYNYVEAVSESYAVVYLNELAPIKPKLIQLITAIQETRDRKVPAPTQFQRMTIEELKEMLFKKVSGFKVVLVFNHFERLTPATSRFWLSISGHERIVFLGSICGNFKKEAFGFYQTFEVVNQKLMKSEGSGSEIDITMPFVLIVGAFIFICFLKISLIGSVMLISALWFAFLVVRTLLYLIR
ncbi:hypothetical protein [Methanobacterium congolense]|uniref:Uncharacterized protein n=1 Tax=Methanobacterium congolense TaxID=118062 RepID=A0A1D3L319_9EURY|nr:hypothetical protein [Methanobacterium congolense]SCG85966.1 putative protein [Methanobacterium congolense]